MNGRFSTTSTARRARDTRPIVWVSGSVVEILLRGTFIGLFPFLQRRKKQTKVKQIRNKSILPLQKEPPQTNFTKRTTPNKLTRSRQTADPLISALFSSLIAPHPEGHSTHFKLGLKSCGWYQPLGQSLHSEPFNAAKRPLEQALHDVAPFVLVSPASHGSQPIRSSLPFVPGGHAAEVLHTPLVQSSAIQPSAISTVEAPPAEI
jgi:hypothetical protein